AAAAYSFHNDWNKRGRLVRNRNGETWTTLGDNLLDDPRNAAGKQHLQDTETHSIYGVLVAFVDNVRRPEEELDVISSWPFAIEAPTERELLLEIVPSHAPAKPTFEPLAAVFLPARKDVTLDGGWFISGSFAHGEPTLSGFMAAFSLAIPFLPSDTYVSAGVSGPVGDDVPRLILGVGFRAPLFLT